MLRVSDKLKLIASTFSGQGMRVVTAMVMSRFIGPKENGEYFAILLLAGYVLSLGDFAIAKSVVQIRSHEEDAVIDTGVVLAILLFGSYGMITLAAGFYLTIVHHNPDLWKIAAIIAVTNLIGAVYDVQLASLNRRLNFQAESFQNVVFAVSTAMTGITFAVLRWGAYAIALQIFVGQLVAIGFLYWRHPIRWPRRASLEVSKSYWKQGSAVSVSVYVGNIESVIVGQLIASVAGVSGVGLWFKATQVASLFLYNIMTAFERVAYPMLVHNVKDLPRLRILFGKVTVTMLLASFLCLAVVGTNSSGIIACLGPMWPAASPLLRMMAWSIPAGALTSVATMMCMTLGNTRSIAKASALNLVIFIPVAFFVRHLGLNALAACWTLSRYLIAFTMLTSVTKIIGTGLWDIRREIIALFISAGVAMGFILVTNHSLAAHLSLGFVRQWLRSRSVSVNRAISLESLAATIVQLTVAFTVGTSAYIVCLWIIRREVLAYAWRMARGNRAIQSPIKEVLGGVP